MDPRKYLPSIYTGIREIDVLSEAEKGVLKYILEEYQQILANQFVLTANQKGIEQFENILGIAPDRTLDLSMRRQKVISKMSSSNVFTLKALKNNLKDICDYGEYALLMDYENFFMGLTVRIGRKGMLDALYDLLYTMLPAHVGFDIKNRIQINPEIRLHGGGCISMRKIIRVTD